MFLIKIRLQQKHVDALKEETKLKLKTKSHSHFTSILKHSQISKFPPFSLGNVWYRFNAMANALSKELALQKKNNDLSNISKRTDDNIKSNRHKYKRICLNNNCIKLPGSTDWGKKNE